MSGRQGRSSGAREPRRHHVVEITHHLRTSAGSHKGAREEGRLLAGHRDGAIGCHPFPPWWWACCPGPAGTPEGFTVCAGHMEMPERGLWMRCESPASAFLFLVMEDVRDSERGQIMPSSLAALCCFRPASFRATNGCYKYHIKKKTTSNTAPCLRERLWAFGRVQLYSVVDMLTGPSSQVRWKVNGSPRNTMRWLCGHVHPAAYWLGSESRCPSTPIQWTPRENTGPK